MAAKTEVEASEEDIQDASEIDSYWPAIIGLSAGGIAVTGALMILSGFSILFGAAMGILFLILILAFVRDEIHKWPKVTANSLKTLRRGGVTGDFHEIGGVGFPVAIFLLTEVMLFAGAFGMFFYLRSGYAVWPPPEAPQLNIFIPSIQTAFLITSSVLIEYATSSVKRGNQNGVKIGFLGAVVLGALFFAVQFGFEWPNLLLTGELLPSDGLFGASFFLLTGFHGVHVLAGVIANGIVTVRAFMGQFSEKNHGFLESAGTYWHFVHIVWLFLFAFLWQGGLGFF
ncbi:MAG: cytochrome c oxidase subunit 3 [Nitrososphaerales archaeon]